MHQTSRCFTCSRSAQKQKAKEIGEERGAALKKVDCTFNGVFVLLTNVGGENTKLLAPVELGVAQVGMKGCAHGTMMGGATLTRTL